MKLSANQIVRTLSEPSHLAAILLHGDDAGLVRDRANIAVRAVIGSLDDPFRLSILTRDEHDRLGHEVASRSLGGGRRVVRVRDATDALAGPLGRLGDYRADVLLVVEAAALPARSKLRTSAEGHPHWAVIACYPERAAAIAIEVSRVMQEAGVMVEPDALTYLASELAGDSVRRRTELEKLLLFAAVECRVTLAMAQACCATDLTASLSAAVGSALSGDAARCDALLDELEREGAGGPGLLAVLSVQLHRVLKVRLHADDGRPVEDAARGLYPPVFPQQMPVFLQDVRHWSTSALEALGRATRDADIACKRAGAADFAIAARLLSAVASRRKSV